MLDFGSLRHQMSITTYSELSTSRFLDKRLKGPENHTKKGLKLFDWFLGFNLDPNRRMNSKIAGFPHISSKLRDQHIELELEEIFFQNTF